MNYIEQIRFFWRSHEEHSFSTTEIALYFHLLEICNSCQWKNPFKRRNNKIEADLNISYNTLKNSRNRLAQYNIISFKSQNGNSNVEYTLSNFDEVSNEVSNEVGSEVSNEVSNEVGSEVSNEVSNEVGSEVSNEVSNEVGSEVIDEVDSEVRTRFLRGSHEVLSDININKTKTKLKKEINKEINKEKPLSLVFPYTSPLFFEKWNLLLSLPKWKCKVTPSLQLALDKLRNYEENFAIEIIDQAIQSEWGCFKGVLIDELYKVWQKDKKSRESKKKGQIMRFNAPSVDEVKSYCAERANNVDPQKFVDFYQSKGWMVGKNKMKDWKAAVRTWENEKNKNNEQSGITESLARSVAEGIARASFDQ